MEENRMFFDTVNEMRRDNCEKQKRGLHFMLTAVLIWTVIALIHGSDLSILMKNRLSLCCSVPLMPLAYLISKLIKVDFQNKGNPLTNLGIIFSVNQILYILIAMWVFSSVPQKMLMVYAIIFGAHLMPYGWTYHSKAYFVMSVVIPVGALLLGLFFQPVVLAAAMAVTEVVLCIWLYIENRSSAVAC